MNRSVNIARYNSIDPTRGCLTINFRRLIISGEIDQSCTRRGAVDGQLGDRLSSPTAGRSRPRWEIVVAGGRSRAEIVRQRRMRRLPLGITLSRNSGM